MTGSRWTRVRLVCMAWVSVILLESASQAGQEVTLQTAIPATQVLPQKDSVITISADARKQPVGRAELQFDLTALPAGARLETCALRVVLGRKVADGDYSGVFIQLKAQNPSSRQWEIKAGLNVPPGTEKDTALLLRDPALCQGLTPGGGAQLRLETETRDKALGIDGDIIPDNVPPDVAARTFRFSSAYAPRLILGYPIDAGTLADADWGQVRRDARHTGRSRGRLYDPNTWFSPTKYAVRPLDIPKSPAVTSLRQSPLLFGGGVWAAFNPALNDYRIRGFTPTGAPLRESRNPLLQPKAIAAGPHGPIYYVTEQHIAVFPSDGTALTAPPATDRDYALTYLVLSALPRISSPSGGESPPDPTTAESIREVPTIAADGTLYFVTQSFVRGYSAGPTKRELWRYPTGPVPVGPVTLSEDERTAYVLFGGKFSRLVALDAATGECRWSQPFPSPIVFEENKTMPIPVVAGQNIFVTRQAPVADTLFIIRDEPSQTGAGSVLMPTSTACERSEAPGGIEALQGTDIPTPVVGPGKEAFYVKSGNLCWARGPGEGACIDRYDFGPARPLPSCTSADLRGVRLLVGDSSGGSTLLPSDGNKPVDNATHLYGLDPERSSLLALSLIWGTSGSLLATCQKAELPGLGPNLILAPGGTLYNQSPRGDLQQIVAAEFGSVPAGMADTTLTRAILEKDTGITFRAPKRLLLEPGLSVPAGSDLTLVAGKQIVFPTGFSVKPGARLRARAGF